MVFMKKIQEIITQIIFNNVLALSNYFITYWPYQTIQQLIGLIKLIYFEFYIKMDEVSKEQIICIFDNDDSTPIFDKDDWEAEALNNQNTIQISLGKNNQVDQNIVKKVNQQIEKSKQNFFKVNIIKKTTDKPSEVNKKASNNNPQNIQLPSINETNKNYIIIQGYIDKKTDGFIFKWHRRYLVLTAQKLYFFTCQKKIQVVACVNLKILPTKIKEIDNQLVLDFAGQCENIILKPENDSSRKIWKANLQLVIDYQAKQKKVMIKTMVKPLYNCQDTISQKQFIQTAETGDILLFYTKNTGAQIQRFITNSNFDHVAMVIKFRKNDLMIFQSNQMYGVSIYEWKQYIQYFDLYQRITIRKLNYIKKTDVQRELLNFVKNNLGKNYEINLSKLISFQSDVNWETINKQKNKERGYFCSELIAKALKSVGLLEQKKSSGRYWPVDFAQKSGMLLKKGAFLGKQQVILLNKHLKNHL